MNIKTVGHMTPELLAQQDHNGEVIGWLHRIQQMIDGEIDSVNPSPMPGIISR